MKNSVVIFLLLAFLAFGNFILFGFSSMAPDGDAVGYIAYGENLALGKGYSIDGETFDVVREPAYPFFLFFIFKIFGIGNLTAVKIFQAILLALIAFFVYLSFKLYGREKTGLITALAIAVIPAYGHYANLLYSETFFAFLLSLSFYLTLRLIKREENALFYGITGAVFALAALTRLFIIFLPLLLGLGLLFVMRKNLRNIVVFYLTFLLLIGSWVGYVHYKTGIFTVTQGRLEYHLYARAVRSTLSYRESLYYMYSWLRRSALGGEDNEFTGKYDMHPLNREYEKILAQPGYSPSRVRTESIAVILNNPGHYLFGNAIEWVKLVWIEHLYPPVSPLLGRFVRLAFYTLLYGIFLFGSIHFLRNRRQKLVPVFWLAAVFLLYNWAVISSLDALPRFNMPYIFLYAVIGVAGLASRFEQADKKING